MNARRFLGLLICALLAVAGSAALADTVFSLPADTKVIGPGAFENTNLSQAELYLPEGLDRIENGAFAGSGVTVVRLPASLTYIARDAFDRCPDFCPIVTPGSYAARWCDEWQISAFQVVSLGVPERTPSAIRSFCASQPVDLNADVTFRREPPEATAPTTVRACWTRAASKTAFTWSTRSAISPG